MDSGFQLAEVIHGKCKNVASLVNSVRFHGVSKTKHDALVKEVSELYNCRTLDELVKKADLAATHMREVGLFDAAVPLIDTAQGTNGYAINFLVKEPSKMSVGVKAGMTTHGEADVCVTGGRQSFNGRGESVDASYTKTFRNGQSFNLSVNKPLLGWQKYTNFGASVYRAKEFIRWNKIDTEENGLILRYNGQIFDKKLKHGIKINSLWRSLYPIDDKISNRTPFLIREHAGHSTKFSIENTLSVDTRDRAILASKGFFASWTMEQAGLIGDASFMRNQIDLQAAAPLFLGAFLSASVQCNMVQPMANKTLHLNDRVYLGGAHDIRGFEQCSIGPRSGPPGQGGASLGGAASFALAAHLYRPLIPANMLYAHAFFAGGSVSSVKSRSWMQDISESSRASAGIGLTFVFKDMIRLELNYVVPLLYVPSDSTAPGIQFGAGLNFL